MDPVIIPQVEDEEYFQSVEVETLKFGTLGEIEMEVALPHVAAFLNEVNVRFTIRGHQVTLRNIKFKSCVYGRRIDAQDFDYVVYTVSVMASITVLPMGVRDEL